MIEIDRSGLRHRARNRSCLHLDYSILACPFECPIHSPTRLYTNFWIVLHVQNKPGDAYISLTIHLNI